MKTCNVCKIEKASDQFSIDRSRRDGKSYTCRECTNARQRARYVPKPRKTATPNRVRLYARAKRLTYGPEKRAELAAYAREWRSRNPELVRAQGATKRARKMSLPFETVTVRQIAVRDGANCWMCGVELSDWEPAHLDHLIPVAADPKELDQWGATNPGTVEANMALACPKCNVKKGAIVMPCAVARYVRNVSASLQRS